jgi:hypothetical protein
VKLVEYIRGSATRILFMDCDQKKYDVKDFLELIETARPKDYNQLTALLDRTATNGVIWNDYKTKRLNGEHAKPICEFCARGGSRIFWFFDERDNSIIVCTHGFIAKGTHEHRPDIERAQQRRVLYYDRKRIGGGK